MVDYTSLMNPTGTFNWAALGALALVYVIFGLAVYIYTALALMAIAKKTNTNNGWLAFIPIANIYLLTQIAGISGWWTLGILLSVIPVVGGILVGLGMIYLYWKTAEKVGKPGWWGILMIIPIVGWILLGIMAWGK
jgi:uncharacterized membrane protein YhaH (DUF805 family)